MLWVVVSPELVAWVIGCVTFGQIVQPLACAFQKFTWFLVLLSPRILLQGLVWQIFAWCWRNCCCSPNNLYVPNLGGCEGPLATRRHNVRLRAKEYDKISIFRVCGSKVPLGESIVGENGKITYVKCTVVVKLSGEKNFWPSRLISSCKKEEGYTWRAWCACGSIFPE